LEISFETTKWHKRLSSSKELNKAYSAKVAQTVTIRMTQLVAADNLGQISHLPPMGLHKLTADRKHQYAVWIKEKYRIVFYGLYDDHTIIEDSDYPKESIKKIRIIEVVNYHV